MAKYDQLLAFAAIIVEIAKDCPRLRQQWDSNAPVMDKAPLMISLASMAVLRAVTGVVPAGAHLLAMSLEGYCDLAFLATGGQQRAPLDWTAGLQRLHTQLSSAHRQIFDGENYYNFVTQHLVMP